METLLTIYRISNGIGTDIETDIEIESSEEYQDWYNDVLMTIYNKYCAPQEGAPEYGDWLEQIAVRTDEI